MKPIKAWHFSNGKLGYGDNRKIKAEITHKVKGEPMLCVNGLHASVRAYDALSYAPGNIVSRVIIGGEIVKGDDKLVGTERTYLWVADAEETLREFARWCALQVIHLWDAPEVVVEYLKTGDESLRAAAWSVAIEAVWSAVWSAARAAAGAAAGAAWAAAGDAARDAAGDAARAAAVDAFEKKANRKLTLMLNKLEPK